MSLTTVLVPIAEEEVRQLLAGESPKELLERARTLRARVAQVDAVREDLHALFYPVWESAQAGADVGRPVLDRKVSKRINAGNKPFVLTGFLHPGHLFELVLGMLGRGKPVEMSSGYDPYVHLFGRSLPAAGKNPRAVAERIDALLKLDDAAFDVALRDDLTTIDPRSAEVPKASDRRAPVDLEAAFASMQDTLRHAVAAQPSNAVEAWDDIVRVSAWSRPVWRLDGEMLPTLLRAAGLTTFPERPATLLERLVADHPEQLRESPDFRGAGGYLTPVAIKQLALAVTAQHRLAQSVNKDAEDVELALRNLRLFSEAVFFCERAGLGLAEAAGVEWHDRPR